MTTGTAAIGAVRGKGLWVPQTLAMSKRSVIAMVRQPALVIPSLIFPLFFAALGSSSFGRAVRLPNFPKVDNFLDFALAGTIVQGVLFGSVTGGAALATDIEQGFFDRLLTTPTSRVGILVGRLAGAAIFGAFQALFFIVVLLPFGVRIKAGVAGVIAIVLCGGLTAMAIGGFTAAMALKTGSSEAVQGSFPLLFIALFFSSAFFPRQTMQGAYKKIADINPVSHLVEGVRGLVTDGFTAQHVAAALLVPTAIGVLSIALAVRTLNLATGGPMSTSVMVPTSQPSGGTLLRSARGLAMRGLQSIRRLPSAFFPALAMPIFQTIVFSGTFFAITKIPGFPTHRSVNWYLPLACCMGSGFGGIGLGFSTVRDIESGFFDRLRMAPAPRLALIIGPLFTVWTVLIVITTALLVGFLFGARLTGGVVGLVLMYVAGLGIATVAAGWGLGLAYRFRDMRAAALMQLTFFNAIFLTNAQAPLSVMSGWLHAVARLNPFTNILRLAREGWLGDVTWNATWGGLVSIVGLSALTLTFAYRGLAKLAD